MRMRAMRMRAAQRVQRWGCFTFWLAAFYYLLAGPGDDTKGTSRRMPADQRLLAKAKPTGANRDMQGAWDIVWERIIENIADPAWQNVTYPTPATPTEAGVVREGAAAPAAQQGGDALRILILDGAVLRFKMNWHTGEHLQWADIIFALTQMGHQVYVADAISWTYWYRTPGDWDLVITDYASLGSDWRSSSHARQSAAKKSAQEKLRCKLRVLDTFGTSSEFNYGKDAPGRPALQIKTEQFYGYYPDVAPGSTFIGFTVSSQASRRQQNTLLPGSAPKKWQAVIWGKSASYLNLDYYDTWLKQISTQIPILSTLAGPDEELNNKSYITNLGILPKQQYWDLLHESALLIGLGQPYW